MSSKHIMSILYVFVEQAPGAQGIAQVYKTPVCLAPDSFPPTPCGHLPLIDFGLFPNSSVGQRREQTSFSCIIDQPCVSPLSIKQSFILPTNDYNMYILKSWGRPKDIKTLAWVIYHFNRLHSLLRNSCFPRGKTTGQCTKEPPSHKFWIGNLWLGSRQPVQIWI